MSRSLTYSGTGTLATWFEPSALQDQVANSLRVHGWGFSDLRVTGGLTGTNSTLLGIANPLIQQIANAVTYNYNISVTLLDAPEDDNPERARVALTNLLSNGWFQNVNLKLTHDSARPMSTFLQNYGLWIAGGFAAVLVLTSLTRQAAPVAYGYARRYARPY